MSEQHERKTWRQEGCVFCDQAPDDKPVYALEPLNPVVPGHLLFIPSNHYRDAAEEPDVTGLVFRAAAAYARQAGESFNLITSAGQNATQTVWHFHTHYVPRREDDGLNLPWTEQQREVTA